MKHIFSDHGGVRKTVMRDAHDPSTIAIKVETNDRPTLERNKQIRHSGLLMQDSRLPLLPDGDVVAFAFQFPTIMDYQLLKNKESELFHQCELGGDAGLRAAERLSILYPQFVVITKRGDARR